VVPESSAWYVAAVAIPTTNNNQLARTMSEAIARTLREQILQGEIAPGSRLQQVAVAEQFGVSTTPVREAFGLLAREGLVRNTAHKGTVVFEANRRDLVDSYEIRVELESLAIRKSVPNLTQDDLAAMRATLDEDAALEPQFHSDHVRLNLAFHSRAYSRCGNEKLLTAIDDWRAATAAYLRLFSATRPSPAETDRQHEKIYEACVRRSAEDASRALRRHLEYTVDVLASHVDDQGE
jgi:DNA-binding GntR family transcriptional regulator